MEAHDRSARVTRCRAAAFRAEARTRDDGGDALTIEGYFAVFNDTYELWPGATESIAPGAFSGVLNDDVRALVNHDTAKVLGRTKAGTLQLVQDETGLFGRVDINPDDTEAMNLYARVKRGDVDQCSFGFEIADERADFRTDGTVHWTILRVDPLYEVSAVTFPAYEATSISARKADYDNEMRRRAEVWREKARKKMRRESHVAESTADAQTN